MYTFRQKTSFLLLLAMTLYLLVIYTYVIFRSPSDNQGNNIMYLHKQKKRISWRQLWASWDHHFRVNTSVEGYVVNTYPDEVKFLINEVNVCEKPLLAIALVITAIKNWQNRHFIRHTWGHAAMTRRTGIKPLFIVGQPKQQTEQSMLDEESSQYHDVLQANFIDSYKNLTYKTIALLSWTTIFCARTPILLKIDDDVLPNPIALSEFLVAYLERNPHPTHILGKLRCCDPVLRVGKWAVPEREYFGKQYPPYVAGPSYIIPTAVIPALLQAIRRTRFLLLEDVYVTGLAAKTGGIKHQSITSLTNSNGNKIGILWCSGAKVFQENVGLRTAARGWNALRKLENISIPEEYRLPSNILS